jgi:DNA primase
VSKNWKEKFNQEVPEREDQYIADITSTLQYIDMRNIRNLLEENERELQKQQTAEKLIILLKTHQHLKSLELEIAKHTGTVILK